MKRKTAQRTLTKFGHFKNVLTKKNQFFKETFEISNLYRKSSVFRYIITSHDPGSGKDESTGTD